MRGKKANLLVDNRI